MLRRPILPGPIPIALPSTKSTAQSSAKQENQEVLIKLTMGLFGKRKPAADDADNDKNDLKVPSLEWSKEPEMNANFFSGIVFAWIQPSEFTGHFNFASIAEKVTAPFLLTLIDIVSYYLSFAVFVFSVLPRILSSQT